MSLEGTSESEYVNCNKSHPVVHPRLSIFEMQEEFDRMMPLLHGMRTRQSGDSCMRCWNTSVRV